jgi:hypothetical protein
MLRIGLTLMAALLLALPEAARSAEDSLAGTWKVKAAADGGPTLWLIRLEPKDGELTGSLLASSDGIGQGTKLTDLKLSGKRLQFTIHVHGQNFNFEGKLSPEGSKEILGTLDLNGRQLVLARLEPSQLKSLDRFELSKEILAQNKGGPEFFEAALTLLREAPAKKATADEVRDWADKAFRAAQPYGARWERTLALRIAQAIASQAGLGPVAYEYARRAERLLERDADAEEQLRILHVVAQTMKKAGKPAEAKGIEARIDKLEELAHQAHVNKVLPFKPEAYAGRKMQSERRVLVELFTGAQCPPCVAADLAFDALGKTYKRNEVVLLQYHLNIPRFDPLSNLATEARAKYFGDQILGTPTIFFNGKEAQSGGGFLAETEDKHYQYRRLIDTLLENRTKAQLQVDAVQKGDTITLTAHVADLDEPGDQVRLRFALVEPWAAYTGANNLHFHHHLVRAMPGGADGFALKQKDGKHTVTVNVEELRKELNQYLDAGEFPPENRPLNLRRLQVVAFVQNDATREVLQAVQVDVQP